MRTPISSFLVVSAMLFSIGTVGVLVRRNALVIFMSVELMLNAVNLTFVALSYYLRQLSAQVFVFFVMVVAAAEAAVGLAMVIAIFRSRRTVALEALDTLRG